MIIILLPRANVNVWNVGEVTASVEVTFSIGKGNVVLANLGRPPVESVVGPSPFKDAPDAPLVLLRCTRWLITMSATLFIPFVLNAAIRLLSCDSLPYFDELRSYSFPGR